MQGPPGHIPVDILGLADKAASAVQALQSQNKYHMSTPGGPMQQQQQQPGGPMGYPSAPYGQPQMSAPHPYPAGNPHQNAGPDAGKPRRRTTAAVAELPVTVQYAVQVSNLRSYFATSF
jgi:hypothetical protein